MTLRNRQITKGLPLPVIVWILRFVIGIVFVFSGFVKAVDPWGFIFKIEEYFASWGMSFPRTVILVGAISISAAEFVLGFLLATGCFKKWAPRFLLLSMAVMLPLTAYIWISNPVSDCGCFGDALKLSNFATFIKNLAITALLLILCRTNFRVKSAIYAPSCQWMAGVIGFIYIIALALYGYNIQPLVDFRSYPEGTDLAKMLEISSDTYEPEIEFIYERDGKRRAFTIDELPDSTWTFVDRRIVNDIDVESIAIFDGDMDVTDQVIASEGIQILLIIPELLRADISYSYAINEIYSAIVADGGDMIALIAAGENGINDWKDISMAQYQCYTVEDTTLKQLARGTISLIYLSDGRIQWKRTISSFDFDTIESIGYHKTRLSDAVTSNGRILSILTFSAIGLLLIIYMFQLGITPLKSFFYKKKQKKDVPLQK